MAPLWLAEGQAMADVFAVAEPETQTVAINGTAAEFADVPGTPYGTPDKAELSLVVFGHGEAQQSGE